MDPQHIELARRAVAILRDVLTGEEGDDRPKPRRYQQCVGPDRSRACCPPTHQVRRPLTRRGQPLITTTKGLDVTPEAGSSTRSW
jgi:hypothetical protein